MERIGRIRMDGVETNHISNHQLTYKLTSKRYSGPPTTSRNIIKISISPKSIGIREFRPFIPP